MNKVKDIDLLKLLAEARQSGKVKEINISWEKLMVEGKEEVYPNIKIEYYENV